MKNSEPSPPPSPTPENEEHPTGESFERPQSVLAFYGQILFSEGGLSLLIVLPAVLIYYFMLAT